MEEVLLWSVYAVCIAIKFRKTRNPRRKWSRQWLLQKRTFSHTKLLRELRNEPNDWRNYLKMDEDTYIDLLRLVSPIILKNDTVMRRAISPHERLSATLRFLATGRSLKDMEFSTAISKPALCKIIPETCEAIYKVLKKLIQIPKTTNEWLKIASAFEEMWQFPHCLGAIDGKHVQIVPPQDSGSHYYNYKKTHSIVLMAVANAHCEFIYCDVGTNGRISDGGVLNNTIFYEKLINKQLNIPESEPVSFDHDLEYVFVGDDAFALRPDLIKPYSRDSLNNERRVCNRRISRARRVIENTFGILTSRFRIFNTAINLKVETIVSVVLACCALHNLLRKKSVTYTPFEYFDNENIIDGTIQIGARCNPDILHNRRSGGRVLQEAKIIREKFCTYFNGEGSVPWQEKSALNV
ncbi:putative nuclease HARBI1 [Homalodisca vitripennis]|uniref:putative nuclease HARBI1 n=1 Tax=Homalodisca vitripennis TaxID=197043 RepID=UPI001EEC12AE|nr:putative nuclease HARBI1 [Homalodisca vitripennis]